jgi:hypothetical protein
MKVCEGLKRCTGHGQDVQSVDTSKGRRWHAKADDNARGSDDVPDAETANGALSGNTRVYEGVRWGEGMIGVQQAVGLGGVEAV